MIIKIVIRNPRAVKILYISARNEKKPLVNEVDKYRT